MQEMFDQPAQKTVEIDLPLGGGGSPSMDSEYDDMIDRTIRAAIPLGCRYVKHTTKKIYKEVATITYELPPKR